MSNFAQIKKEAWTYYQTWMKEKTYCPALGKEVTVTRKGWDHILQGSNNRRRQPQDILNKLSLLKSAKHVIKTSKTTRNERFNNTTYIVLEGKSPDTRIKNRIRVLLKKDTKGKVIFYSVMKH